MSERRDFRLTEVHLKLIRRMYVGWQRCEYGAPEIDPKRPYGNGNVEFDIATIVGWPLPDEESSRYDEEMALIADMARAVHRETQTALQIVVTNAGRSVLPGLYRMAREFDSRSWERVGD